MCVEISKLVMSEHQVMLFNQVDAPHIFLVQHKAIGHIEHALLELSFGEIILVEMMLYPAEGFWRESL